MAHTGIFATSDEILVKAGENYDTSITEARINDLASQSESMINGLTRNNWSDAYSGLNADVKRLLSAASSSWCAMHIISFKMKGDDGSLSLREAEDRINVQRDDFLRLISILRDKKVEDFLEGA